MTVVVVSPHPDDETAMCGGTLRLRALEGEAVLVVVLTSGEAGGHGTSPEETARIREGESIAAGALLGVDDVQFWHEPDGRLAATAALVQRMRTYLSGVKPDTVFVPNDREQHPDHRAAARLVRRAVASLPPDARPVVLMAEVWTPLTDMTEIVDISPVIEDKVAALRAYRSQCEVLRFDDAFLALARYRGEMHSWPGGDFAEIFQEMKI